MQAEKWRRLVEAFAGLMMLTGPATLDRASMTADVTVSVSL